MKVDEGPVFSPKKLFTPEPNPTPWRVSGWKQPVDCFSSLDLHEGEWWGIHIVSIVDIKAGNLSNLRNCCKQNFYFQKMPSSCKARKGDWTIDGTKIKEIGQDWLITKLPVSIKTLKSSTIVHLSYITLICPFLPESKLNMKICSGHLQQQC